MKPRIIVSAVNLTEMGPLAVFQDALESLSSYSNGRYKVIALVHRRKLFNVLNVIYLEFPDIKSSWSKRLIFEYWTSKRISRRLRPKLWLSMDNVTPRVVADIQVVYCHNPSPFYRFRPRDILLDWKFGFFTLFFRYLYAINIRSNDHVIVQQDWIRRQFERFYRVNNVIVAHPDVHIPEMLKDHRKPRTRGPYRFFYPAFPRTFKNMEIVLHAVRLLEQEGFHDFELWLTFDGSVNRYAAEMAMQFSDLKSVRWLGLLPRTRVFELYDEADCLLFASKLETWGMPITEFKTTGKPILAANLSYAHETVGSYDQVVFFDPENAEKLADIMKSAASNEPVFAAVGAEAIAPPSSKTWVELWSLIVP